MASEAKPMSEARKRSISLTRSMTKGTEEMMMQIRGFLASHPQQAAQMGIEVRPSIGTARVAQALPEVAEKPPPPRTPSPPASPPPQPSSAREVGARRFWRRSFYALVIGILLLLGNYVSELAMLEEESHAKQEYVVQEVQTGKSWIVRVVVVQAVLLGFNAFLGYRGVKVWLLFRRIRLGEIIRNVRGRLKAVKWTFGLFRRTGKVVSWATLPVRAPIRAFRNAHKQRAALRKAQAAKRTARKANKLSSRFAQSLASKAMVCA